MSAIHLAVALMWPHVDDESGRQLVIAGFGRN